MPNDPKYVRLASHMQRSMLADITGGSGWSISGTTVLPFPPRTRRDQQRFVRQKLAAGMLEVASKAELDEQMEANEQYDELVAEATKDGHQEAAIQEAADKVREGLEDEETAPSDDPEDDSDDDDDDADEDGDEEQVEEPTPRAQKRTATKRSARSR